MRKIALTELSRLAADEMCAAMIWRMEEALAKVSKGGTETDNMRTLRVAAERVLELDGFYNTSTAIVE